MNIQEQTSGHLEQFAEFDTLSTNDQNLAELARSIAGLVETGSVKIVDLNNLIANRYIRIMVLSASDSTVKPSKLEQGRALSSNNFDIRTEDS